MSLDTHRRRISILSAYLGTAILDGSSNHVYHVPCNCWQCIHMKEEGKDSGVERFEGKMKSQAFCEKIMPSIHVYVPTSMNWPCSHVAHHRRHVQLGD